MGDAEKTIKWTEEQTHVIDTRQGNLLVSAAAGSGKTAVLVERIIEMITDDRLDIDELLVVTFTNAAAAQMKEKISRELQKRIDGDGVCDEHLIRQLTLINRADICTIDSFCLRIVKEYFSRLELDSAFDIGDGTEMELLRRDVMDAVLERCYADETLVPGYNLLVGCFARKERDEAVAELVFKTAGVISSCPEPYKWLDSARKAMRLAAGGDKDAESAERVVMSVPMVKAYAHSTRYILEAALDMARDCSSYTNENYKMESFGGKIDEDIYMLTHMLRCVDESGEPDIFAMRRVYDDCGAFAPLGRAGKAADAEKKQLVTGKRKLYTGMVKDAMEVVCSASDAVSQAEFSAPVLTALADLTELYMRELMRAKHERNRYEFHDIEEFAFMILCDGIEDGRAVPSDAGKEVSRRYREILIDEYQDSNFLQEYILASVAGHGEDINNTFMVGDVKQSIYRFRMARPDLFIHKYDMYRQLLPGEAADANGAGNTILLTRNFRSDVNVLRTVNGIFEKLMRKEAGGIEYDDAARLKSDRSGSGEKSEFILMENSMESVDPYGSYSNTCVEAAYLASKIDELVNGDKTVYVTDGDDKRPVRYSDIVILLRSVSSAVADFDRIFEEAGIPLYIESEKGYFDAAEVSNLMSMLSVIDNSYIDYDMAAVLRSPLVGLNEEELALIVGEYRAGYESSGTDYTARLYDKLVVYMETHSGEDSDAMRRLCDFTDMLTYLKENKSYMSISDILRYVLDRTGFYWFAGARSMGRRRQANIDMLIKKADDFERNSKGVFNFIRYVGELRTHDLDFAEADVVGGDENVVRVMTMHKSKGLEFPIVFVSNLGKEFNKRDMRAAVLVHQDYYLSCNSIDANRRVRTDSFFKKIMAAAMESELYAEEMRVLYVALTRAKEKLYMTACVNDLEKYKTARNAYVDGADRMSYAAVMGASGMLDWIYTAFCYADYHEYAELKEVDIRSFIASASNGNIHVRVSRGGSAETVCRNESRNGELAAAVRRAVDFTYGHRASGLRSKLSITEIKKLQAYGDGQDSYDMSSARSYTPGDGMPVPKFMSGERKAAGNEIGTIYHKIMELADFRNPSPESAAAAKDRVFCLGLFDESYKDSINSEKIYRMLSGPLGRRMAAADLRGALYRERQFYMMMKPEDILPSCTDCGDETIVVQGIIDAYFIEDGEIVLMDYKTDTVKDVSELSARYHVQLDKYAAVLEQLSGMRVKEKIIYSFCLDTTVNL